MNRPLGLAALAAFTLCVLAANAAVEAHGVFGYFGLVAPWGALFAGLSFQLRDVGQEHAGWPLTVAAIAAGTLLSVVVDPALALASGLAFAVSESADLAVYTPLRRRSWTGAVLASGVVGALLDSAIFLALADAIDAPFLAFTARSVAGLALVKLAVVAATAALAAPARRQLAPELHASPGALAPLR